MKNVAQARPVMQTCRIAFDCLQPYAASTGHTPHCLICTGTCVRPSRNLLRSSKSPFQGDLWSWPFNPSSWAPLWLGSFSLWAMARG